jgi:hypothetical protein
MSINYVTARVIAKIKLQKLLLIGYLIDQEEKRVKLSCSSFLNDTLAGLNSLEYQRSSLFEAKRLYNHFKRYVYVIDGTPSLASVKLPSNITKTHLNLLINNKMSEQQEDIFIERVSRQGLSTQQLSVSIKMSLPVDPLHNLLMIDGWIIPHFYNFSLLSIDSS